MWLCMQASCFLNDNWKLCVYAASLLTFSLLVYLFHSVGAPWPFKMMPLPHSDSTPSLAFGLVTDAERSFDIVPVSQRFVGYLSFKIYLFTFALDLFPKCSICIPGEYFDASGKHEQMTGFCEAFAESPFALAWEGGGEWEEITGRSRRRETSGVVTVRVGEQRRTDGAQQERSILI